MKKLIMLLAIAALALTGCMSAYYMEGKGFDSMEEGFAYKWKVRIQPQLDKIVPGEYFGGSLMMHIPSDHNLSRPPYVQGMPTGENKRLVIGIYKQDFKGIKAAIEKARLFDSVDMKQESSYLRIARNYGYRYLLVNNGDGTFTIFDMSLDEDKTLRFPKGLDNLAYAIEDAIFKFEKKRPNSELLKGYKPPKEEMTYDDKTRKGSITVHGKGIEARAWMLRKIGEIADSKNVALSTGQEAGGGRFAVLNESISAGKFTIEFETLY